MLSPRPHQRSKPRTLGSVLSVLSSFIRFSSLPTHATIGSSLYLAPSRLVGRRVSFAFVPPLLSQRRHIPPRVFRFVHCSRKERAEKGGDPHGRGRPRLVPSPSLCPAFFFSFSGISLSPSPQAPNRGASSFSCPLCLSAERLRRGSFSRSPYMYITPHPFLSLSLSRACVRALRVFAPAYLHNPIKIYMLASLP